MTSSEWNVEILVADWLEPEILVADWLWTISTPLTTTIDKEKVQSLDTNIVNMTLESLNLWLTFALYFVGLFLFFWLSELLIRMFISSLYIKC